MSKVTFVTGAPRGSKGKAVRIGRGRAAVTGDDRRKNVDRHGENVCNDRKRFAECRTVF